MTIEEAILEKVRTLPPEKQHEVLDFTEFLQARTQSDSGAPKPPRKSLQGLWADLNFTIAEDDITELRREMWQNFPREDIA